MWGHKVSLAGAGMATQLKGTKVAATNLDTENKIAMMVILTLMKVRMTWMMIWMMKLLLVQAMDLVSLRT